MLHCVHCARAGGWRPPFQSVLQCPRCPCVPWRCQTHYRFTRCCIYTVGVHAAMQEPWRNCGRGDFDLVPNLPADGCVWHAGNHIQRMRIQHVASHDSHTSALCECNSFQREAGNNNSRACSLLPHPHRSPAPVSYYHRLIRSPSPSSTVSCSSS